MFWPYHSVQLWLDRVIRYSAEIGHLWSDSWSNQSCSAKFSNHRLDHNYHSNNHLPWKKLGNFQNVGIAYFKHLVYRRFLSKMHFFSSNCNGYDSLITGLLVVQFCQQSLAWLQTELDYTRSYYHYLSTATLVTSSTFLFLFYYTLLEKIHD